MVNKGDDLKINILARNNGYGAAGDYRNPDTVVKLYDQKGNLLATDDDRQRQIISFNLGDKREPGTYSFQVKFITEAKFDKAIFDKSRYGSNTETVELSVNVVETCDGNLYYTPKASDMCTEFIQMEMCHPKSGGADYPTGKTSVVSGTKS